MIRGITVSDVLKRFPTAKVSGGKSDKSKWSNALATTVDGIKFPSRVQARVYERLVEIFGKEAIRLDVRMPLIAGDRGGGKVLYITIDFCVLLDGRVRMWVDAKTKRRSREWARGAAMFRASWGHLYEWDGSGDPRFLR